MSQPPPPPPSGFGYGPPAYGAPRTSPKAVTALVIGIVSPVLGLCCAFIGLVGIAAILVGRSAKREIAASDGTLSGEGLATAAVVLGIVGCVIGLVMTVINLMLVSGGFYGYQVDVGS